MSQSGLKTAWEKIREAASGELSRSAGVPFKDGAFVFPSLGTDFLVYPEKDKEAIEASSAQGEALMTKFGYFFNHVCLWWLVYAKGIPPTGRLVRPEDLNGGAAFFRGSHTLPLDGLARRYGSGSEEFLKKGLALGGERCDLADSCIKLHPAPRLPIYLILWLEDEEFPARAGVLLDSSAGIVLPLDIIWSAIMLCLLAMV